MTIKLSNLLITLIAFTVFMTVVGMPVIDWFRNAVDLAHASSNI